MPEWLTQWSAQRNFSFWNSVH